MTIPNSKDFEEVHLKKDTMSESDLLEVYKNPIYPRDSKIHTVKGFINIDNGQMGGTQWTCFY